MQHKYPIILASKSPRRQELLSLMGIDFKVVLKEVDESFPDNMPRDEVAAFISHKKAMAFDDSITNEIVITADTIVCLDDLILGKPTDEADAFKMLKILSGRMHKVITGVTILHQHHIHTFSDTTSVYFNNLSDSDIHYYIENYQPFDKAGAYGIQEWIGLVGINKIEGSYTNVMGLPTEKLNIQLRKY